MSTTSAVIGISDGKDTATLIPGPIGDTIGGTMGPIAGAIGAIAGGIGAIAKKGRPGGALTSGTITGTLVIWHILHWRFKVFAEMQRKPTTFINDHKIINL